MPEGEAAHEPLYRQRQPGFTHCRRALKRVQRFQDLIRHKERRAGDFDMARPIEELIPDYDVNRGTQMIDREIGKLQQLVQWDMRYIAMTNTTYSINDPEHIGPDQDEPVVLISSWIISAYRGQWLGNTRRTLQ